MNNLFKQTIGKAQKAFGGFKNFFEEKKKKEEEELKQREKLWLNQEKQKQEKTKEFFKQKTELAKNLFKQAGEKIKKKVTNTEDLFAETPEAEQKRHTFIEEKIRTPIYKRIETMPDTRGVTLPVKETLKFGTEMFLGKRGEFSEGLPSFRDREKSLAFAREMGENLAFGGGVKSLEKPVPQVIEKMFKPKDVERTTLGLSKKVSEYLKFKFGIAPEKATKKQIVDALAYSEGEAIEKFIPHSEEVFKKLGSRAGGWQFDETRPALIYGGLKRGVLTDGYSLVLDKDIAKKVNTELIESQTKKEIKQLQNNLPSISFGEAEKIAKETIKKNMDEFSQNYPDVSKIIPKDLGEKAVIQGHNQTGTLLSTGKVQALVNTDKLAMLKSYFPNAEIRILEPDKPIQLVENGKVKAIVMPIKVNSFEVPIEYGLKKLAPTVKTTTKVAPELEKMFIPKVEGKPEMKIEMQPPTSQKILQKPSPLRPPVVRKEALPSERIVTPKFTERKFSKTVMESEKTAPEVKSVFERQYYQRLPNKQTFAEADKIIAKNYDEAFRIAREEPSTTLNNAISMRLVEKLQSEGNFNQATDLLESLTKKPTSQGQAIQILSNWSKLSPSGAVKYAQKLIDKTTQGVKTVVKTKAKEVGEKLTRELNKTNKEVVEDVVREITETGGVPFAKKPPEKQLAKRIANHLKNKKTKEDPIKDMVNTLYSVAKQKLPEKVRKSRDALELVADAITNREEYEKIWDLARGIVKRKFKDKPEALMLLDNYFGQVLRTPFSEKQLSKVVSKGIKENIIDVGKVVRQHYSVVNKTGQTLKDALVEKAGLLDEDAGILAKSIEKKFAELTKVKKESILKGMFKERIFKKKELSEQIIEMSNLGAFSDSKYYPSVAKKLGIPALDEKTAKEIYDMADKIQTLPDGAEKLIATEKLLYKINSVTPEEKSLLSDILSIPKSLMAGGLDMSYGLRQGVFSAPRHPKMWASSFKDQFKWFFSEKALRNSTEEIVSRPNYLLMKDSKLALTDLGETLSKREELFRSTIAEKIPLLGKFVRASGRAYTGFANKFRADIFDDMVKIGEKTGAIKDPTYLSSAAKFINSTTGRGDLGRLERISGELGTALFSPRTVKSVVDTFNPIYYAKLNPTVRKEAFKTLFAWVTGTATILELAKLAGAEVEKDPTNADFLKIKIGDTRIDIMGGRQQLIVLAARLITKKMTSSTTGREIMLGEGYKSTTRADIIMRFFENKQAPVVSFLWSMLKGKTGTGEDFKAGTEAVKRVTPMFIQDMIDLYKHGGFEVLPLGIPAFFGTGAQTYGGSKEDLMNMGASTRAAALLVKYQKLGSLEEKRAFWKKNVDEKIINEDVGKEFKILLKEEKLGISKSESNFKNLGVKNGERAKAVYKEYTKLENVEDRRKLWDKYVKAKIITDDVGLQVKELLKKPPEPNTLDKFKSLFTKQPSESPNSPFENLFK